MSEPKKYDKAKKAIYNRRYREKNKDKALAYYVKHKQHILTQQRGYRDKNVEKLKNYHKNYWKKKKKKLDEIKQNKKEDEINNAKKQVETEKKSV